jgi:hypothetical protein
VSRSLPLFATCLFFCLLFCTFFCFFFCSSARTQPPSQPGSEAQTQQPPPSTAPKPAEAARNSDIVVTLGSIATLPIPEGGYSETLVSNEEMVGVRTNQDSTKLLITGKSLGTATLTVRLKDKTEQTYTVIVEAQRLQVAKRLRSGFIAYSIDLPKENTVGAILGLNDYVVVFFTRSTDEEKRTIVLMKNIRVVAAPTGTVILEVTTDEAKLLKTSQESGTLALGLIADADLKDEKAILERKGERGSSKKKDQ